MIYLVILLALASIYIWSLVSAAGLRSPTWLIPLTVVMALHTTLHLVSPWLAPRQVWLPVYFVAQGLLALVINQIISLTGVAIGLYLYLILAAQAIGLLSNRVPLIILLVTIYLALAVLNFAWLWGVKPLPSFLVLAAPQALFVIAFTVLFFQQASARRRAQVLLTELETAHQALESAHRQLAERAAQIEDLTLINERQRLARELHDTLAQGLAGLILQLEAADKQLSHGRHERAQAIVTQVMAHARTTLADARRAIDDLRTGGLKPEALYEAIQDEAGRFTTATGLPCTLDLPPSMALPDSLREHLFRTVAEGLTNIARHAHARQAWVYLGQVNGELELIVRDNGVGFDTENVNGHTGHYGLIGLRERARLAGGSLQVVSAPDHGTTVTLRLPIPERADG